MSKPATIAIAACALLCCALPVAGCGGGARQAALITQSAVRPVKDQSARPARADPPQAPTLFSPQSVWNRPLPADAPIDPSSRGAIDDLGAEVAQEEAAKSGPWINTTSYGVPILTVAADEPTVPVALDHAPDAALSSAWSSVPLPPAGRPAPGTDGDLVVWQPSSDRMWEFWRLTRQSDGWHAAWGGAIRHVSSDPGVFGAGAWPGAKPWWGATASSLALAGGVVTIEELRRGQIDHALAIALPEVRAGVFASPARRTDGTSENPLSLPEGAHLRLDPGLDLARIPMPPLTRALAVAAQRYGIVVRDYAGNVTFIGQDPALTGGNPYAGPNGLFEGRYPSQLLASFPWSHLELLRMDLHPNP